MQLSQPHIDMRYILFPPGNEWRVLGEDEACPVSPQKKRKKAQTTSLPRQCRDALQKQAQAAVRPNFFSGKGSRKPLGARGGITSTLRRICTNFFCYILWSDPAHDFFLQIAPLPLWMMVAKLFWSLWRAACVFLGGWTCSVAAAVFWVQHNKLALTVSYFLPLSDGLRRKLCGRNWVCTLSASTRFWTQSSFHLVELSRRSDLP